MKKILFVSKIFLSVVFLIGIFLIGYFFLFSSKDKRYSFAEHSQGLYMSQKLFDILIFQNPEDSNSYFEKSVAFNKRGEYAEGFRLLDKAVELNPDWHLGYRGWLRLVKVKDYRGAIRDLERLDSLTPNVVDYPWSNNIHYLLGLSYKGLKEYDYALNEFNKAVTSEKDSSLVNHNLYLHKGIILKDQGKYTDAIANFNACLEHSHKQSPEAHYQKALVFKSLEKFDSAQISLNKSLELFNNGYKHKDIYNEVSNELYLSDILLAIDSLNGQTQGD